MTDVLIVGFTAEASDLSNSQLDVTALRESLEDVDSEVSRAGYTVTRGWIGNDHEASLGDVTRLLKSRSFDVVLVGAGIRGHARFSELFEQVVNTVHALAPHARFAFNADPASTLDAIRRNG